MLMWMLSGFWVRLRVWLDGAGPQPSRVPPTWHACRWQSVSSLGYPYILFRLFKFYSVGYEETSALKSQVKWAKQTKCNEWIAYPMIWFPCSVCFVSLPGQALHGFELQHRKLSWCLFTDDAFCFVECQFWGTTPSHNNFRYLSAPSVFLLME